MLNRINTPIASGIAAFVMAFALGGAAVGVALVADTVTTDDENPPAAAVDTIATFEDIDGNNIDDDCQTELAVENAEAAAAAAAAVDLDHDGTISRSEAAKSDRIGGKNCNHGGYVSGVAKGDDEDEDEAEGDEDDQSDTDGTFDDVDANGIDDDCQAESAVAVSEAEAAAAAAAIDLDHDGTISKSEAARSGRIGGKNCNHGGYVSGVAKADKADKAANKAAAKAARAEAKAARKAAKDR